ncbi:hypothetical protein ACTXT7_010592 [Hymenolepis weldensis]
MEPEQHIRFNWSSKLAITISNQNLFKKFQNGLLFWIDKTFPFDFESRPLDRLYGDGYNGDYLVGISLLSVVELALIIYLYAIPGNLNKVVEKLLDKTLKTYGENNELGMASVNLWEMIGSGDGALCCGLTGYADFPSGKQLPLSCCKKYGNVTSPVQTCTESEAKAANVANCTVKIDYYIERNKTVFIAVPCGLFAIQVTVLIIMSALCTRWYRSD